jgi:hypothetical protein
MWDSVMDKSGAGAGFLREVRFPLPIYIPSAPPQSSSLSPEAGTIGQKWPQCNSLTNQNLKKRVRRKRRINVYVVSSSQNYYLRPLLNERQIQRRKK